MPVTFALDGDNASDLQGTFDIFCLAGDDKLPVDKLGVALRSVGRNPTEAQLQQFIDERSDPNSSGFEFDEFKDIWKRQLEVESSSDPHQMINSIKFALRAFDRDGSGLIDRDELKGVLVRMGDGLQVNEADDLLRQFGTGSSDTRQVCYERALVRFASMYHKLLSLLAIMGHYYKWFVDSPIKSTMPIFTEWLIPEALGLHTEVWIRAGQELEGTGFHRTLQVELGVAEKDPQNWEAVRVEVTWKVPKEFFIDPWQLQRSAPMVISNESADVWVEWNTEDMKQLIDLEAPAYSQKSVEFPLKATLFVKKHDFDVKQWNVTLSVPEMLIRYQKPETGWTDCLVVIDFPKPKVRLVSIDPSRRPPATALQTQAAELRATIPVGVYHPAFAMATVGSVSVCSLFLLLSLF